MACHTPSDRGHQTHPEGPLKQALGPVCIELVELECGGMRVNSQAFPDDVATTL